MKKQTEMRNERLIKKYYDAIDRVYLNELTLKNTVGNTKQDVDNQILKDKKFITEFEKANFN